MEKPQTDLLGIREQDTWLGKFRFFCTSGVNIMVTRLTGYDKSLFQLRAMAVEQALLVHDHLSKALKSMEASDAQVDWRRNDDAIDKMRDQVVNRSFEMMSWQQLRTQDLRWILGYQRISQELERIADYACDIAELSGLNPEREWAAEVPDMSRKLLQLFEYALSFLKGDKEIDMDLDDEDDALDEVYAHFRQELANKSRTHNLELGLTLLLVRTMERTGDHIVNVAEMLLFIQTGQRRLNALPASTNGHIGTSGA